MTIFNTEASGTHLAGQVTAESPTHAYVEVVDHIKNTAPIEMNDPGDLSSEAIDREWRISLIASGNQTDPNTITYHFRADAPE